MTDTSFVKPFAQRESQLITWGMATPWDNISKSAAGLTDEQLACVSFRSIMRALPNYDRLSSKSQRNFLALFRALSDSYYLLKHQKVGLYGEIDVKRSLAVLLPFARNLGFADPTPHVYSGSEKPEDDLLLNGYISTLAVPEAAFYCLSFHDKTNRYIDNSREFLIKAIFLSSISFLSVSITSDSGLLRSYDAAHKDISFLYFNDSAALLKRPIWPDSIIPSEVQSLSERLLRRLVKFQANWEVWTDWYSGVMNGADPYALVTNKFAENGSTLLAPIWRQPIKTINSHILQLIEFSVNFPKIDTPEIPPQHLAPLMTFESEGQIARFQGSHTSGTTSAREMRRRAGHTALHETLDDFLLLYPTHNHPGLKLAIARIRDALGTTPDEIEPIRAGAAAERIHQYALRADQEFMPLMAADIVTLDVVLQTNLAHFDEWGDYRNEINNDRPASSESVQLAIAVASGLQSIPLLRPEVIEALDEEISTVTDEEVAPTSEEQRTLMRSVSNVLATVSKISLRPFQSSSSTVGGISRVHTAAAGATAIAALKDMSKHLIQLAKESSYFSYIEAVLTFINQNKK